MAALVCSGCDAQIPADELLRFSCPNRGIGDDDHVLRVQLSPDEICAGWPDESCSEANPFIRYRKLSYGYLQAMRLGMADSEYVAIVRELADAIAQFDKPMQCTELSYCDALGCWIKNETENISGSHKARHLIGTAIDMEVASRLGGGSDAPLAIASCGNAALAAAVVAKAAGRRLQVFVPSNADPAVVARLESLGATRIVCERVPGGPAGDPCYLQFREAVEAGALPFSCQGGDNAHAILGGHSLGWELIDQTRSDKRLADKRSTDERPTDESSADERTIDRIFIQVGGGALSSSILQAYRMAKAAGIIDSLPVFYAVQTKNAHPLARAWQLVEEGGDSIRDLRHQRSKYMWPWEAVPESIAGGILDDETYDWLSIVEGLIESGGRVLTVSEERLREAQETGARLSGIAVDATGTSGFSGLLQLRAESSTNEKSEDLVLFTGALR